MARPHPDDRLGDAEDVEQECALLEDAARPVVLSTEPEASVRSRYACVPDLTVIRVGGATP